MVDLAISVRDLRKTFKLPPTSGGRRSLATSVSRRREPDAKGRILTVLDCVSFTVHRGEAFGVVGRNGCGKSTLLRILASVYLADAGSVRVRGTLAPFIDLGVGFNPDLSARDNIVQNGVMMGLTPQRIRGAVDQVLAFAEVDDYADMLLRDYSSGMRVRLAFAVMLQTDPDILILDEILAVGDAAFQEKCQEALVGVKERGKTVVLVTHSMPTVESFCDRAMLIHEGRADLIGNPEGVARRYAEVNAQYHSTQGLTGHTGARRVRFNDAWLVNPDGTRRTTVRPGSPIEIQVSAVPERDLIEPVMRLDLRTARGARVFATPPSALASVGPPGTVLAAGEGTKIGIQLANVLAPGRYQLTFAMLARGGGKTGGGYVPVSSARTISFRVEGSDSASSGLVWIDHEVTLAAATEVAYGPNR
jgi:ABC-type polysaccharide/polyol phosphate transport system ATPase subunit